MDQRRCIFTILKLSCLSVQFTFLPTMYKVSILNLCQDWTLFLIIAHLMAEEMALRHLDNPFKFFPICVSSSVDLSFIFLTQGVFLIHVIYHGQLTLPLLYVLQIVLSISDNCSVGSRIGHWKYIPSEAMRQQGEERQGRPRPLRDTEGAHPLHLPEPRVLSP